MRKRTLSTLAGDSNTGFHSEKPCLVLKSSGHQEFTGSGHLLSNEKVRYPTNRKETSTLLDLTFPIDSNVNWRFPREIILDQMLRRERALSVSTKNESPSFVCHRSEIVSYIRDFYSRSDYSAATRALAIRLVDEVFTLINFKSEETLLIVITCIILAVKFEESDYIRNGLNRIPSKQIIQEYLQDQYSLEQLIYAEYVLISLLGYSLYRETVSSFINFFKSNSIYISDQLFSSPLPQIIAHSKFETVVSDICDLILNDYRFSFCKPSVLSVATIMCGRRAIGIDSWPGELVDAIRASPAEVSLCFKNLWQSYYCSIKSKGFEFRSSIDVLPKTVSEIKPEKISLSLPNCLDTVKVFDYNHSLSSDNLTRSHQELDGKHSFVNHLTFSS